MLKNVVVTGGGTGGHVFTGIAVLDEVRRRNPRARTCFIGSAVGHEVRLVPRSAHSLLTIEVRPLRLHGLTGAARALWRVPGAVVGARGILARVRPEVVLGVGGPASGPTLIAARALGLPVCLHEQNAVPGLANRLAGGFVPEVLVGIPQVRGRFVARAGVIVTGNPVRAELAGRLLAREPRARARGRGAEALNVLVLGGSDGSQLLNARMPAWVAQAARSAGVRVRVRHQAGGIDPARLQDAYAQLGVEAQVASFWHDIASAYLDADVAVTLAGAGTLAELALAAVPALVAPLAGAADDHQRENACHYARSGAIRLLDEREPGDDAACAELAALLSDEALRTTLAQRMRALALPGAAAAIVDALERIAAGERGDGAGAIRS